MKDESQKKEKKIINVSHGETSTSERLKYA